MRDYESLCLDAWQSNVCVTLLLVEVSRSNLSITNWVASYTMCCFVRINSYFTQLLYTLELINAYSWALSCSIFLCCSPLSWMPFEINEEHRGRFDANDNVQQWWTQSHMFDSPNVQWVCAFLSDKTYDRCFEFLYKFCDIATITSKQKNVCACVRACSIV